MWGCPRGKIPPQGNQPPVPPGFQAEHFGQSFVETHLLQAVLAARGFGRIWWLPEWVGVGKGGEEEFLLCGRRCFCFLFSSLCVCVYVCIIHICFTHHIYMYM